MRRLSNNRDLFEAQGGEQITVTVEASKVPYQATFSALESGAAWTKVQNPTLQRPVEVRRFAMPNASREFSVISYGFPPVAVTDPAAKYTIMISGGGTTDGPNDVLPPPSGTIVNPPYEFRLPGGGVESMVAGEVRPAPKKKAAKKGGVKKKAAPKRRVAPKKKAAPKRKTGGKKSAAKKVTTKKSAVKKSATRKGPKRSGRK